MDSNPKQPEAGIDPPDIDPARLDEIQGRVNGFLEKIQANIAYDLEAEDSIAKGARLALDNAVMLYAQGGVDALGVEACARAFVKACKRPEPPPQPPTDKERWKWRPGNYQSSYVPKCPPGMRSHAVAERDARRACENMYFVGETPPPEATIRDCIDGGLLPPGANETGALARDAKLAKLPKSGYIMPDRRQYTEAELAALEGVAATMLFRDKKMLQAEVKHAKR